MRAIPGLLQMARARSASLDGAVFERDRGLCAKCGRDTEHVRRQIDSYHAAAMRQLGDPLAASLQTGSYLRAMFPEFAQRYPYRLWDRHHIKALGEGGSEAMDNQQTLCAAGCHKAETAKLMKRLLPYRRGHVYRPAEA